MKKKVSELEGAELAEWVARAQGWELVTTSGYVASINIWVNDTEGDYIHLYEEPEYRPDLNWSQAGELIDRFGDNMDFYENCVYLYPDKHKMTSVRTKGETRKIQICRAVVASKYGEWVGEEDE